MVQKRGVLSKLIAAAVWITGILVSLAVGFGMIDKNLTVRWIPEVITSVAGWIVVVLTILGLILTVFDR